MRGERARGSPSLGGWGGGELECGEGGRGEKVWEGAIVVGRGAGCSRRDGRETGTEKGE